MFHVHVHGVLQPPPHLRIRIIRHGVHSSLLSAPSQPYVWSLVCPSLLLVLHQLLVALNSFRFLNHSVVGWHKIHPHSTVVSWGGHIGCNAFRTSLAVVRLTHAKWTINYLFIAIGFVLRCASFSPLFFRFLNKLEIIDLVLKNVNWIIMFVSGLVGRRWFKWFAEHWIVDERVGNSFVRD